MTLLQRSLSLFILWMCCVIESFSSWSDSGTSLYTTSFRWPQRKKSRGFRSGEYGAQTKLVFRLITRSPKFLASQWLAMSCPRRRRHILTLIYSRFRSIDGDVSLGVYRLTISIIVLKEKRPDDSLTAHSGPDSYPFRMQLNVMFYKILYKNVI